MLCPQRPQKRMFGGYAPPQRRQIRSACGGRDVGDAEPDAPDLGAMLSPQRPQKREFSGSGEEHLGHGNVFAESDTVTTANDRPPHRPQNFTPSANRE